MCGISGVYHSKAACPVELEEVLRMIAPLQHRGPDEYGVLLDESLGMGMTRLSIIDLNTGSQPIANEDDSIWVTFNGEIFNYPELREGLQREGHQFRTQSDTEVLVHLYERHGNNFLHYLNGQFAIALWDRPRRKLLLARDRVGIRPLFYHRTPAGSIYYASEMKSIFAGGALQPRIDLRGTAQIFTFWANIPPATCFEGVQELPPGHLLTMTPESVDITCYWQPEFPASGDFSRRSRTELSQELRELLHDATTIRLRADVPVATYLSGGIDSSILTGLVKRHHNNSLMSFSVAFEDREFDERSYQDLAVRHLGTDHRTIEITNNDIADSFADVIYLAEKPMIRSAPAPLLALSRLVRDHDIKVVLTGEGADEAFGGYNIFKEDKIRRFWARQPQSTCRPMLLAKLYPYILDQARGINPFWQKFFQQGLENVDDPFYSHTIRWNNSAKLGLFLSEQMKEHFHPQDFQEELRRQLPPDFFGWHSLNRAQFLEMQLFMSGYLLSSQGDRMMMGNSVEGRFPYLDHRLLEFAAQLPPEMKIRGLSEKHLLKETFSDLLPAKIVRRSKQPYRAPICQAFLAKNAPDSIRRVLEPDYLKQCGYFKPDAVNRLITKLSATPHPAARDEMALNSILSLQLLHYQFIDSFSQRTFKLPPTKKIRSFTEKLPSISGEKK